MSKLKVEKKRKSFDSSISYFALKSQDEIYYQMASIFKAVTKNEEQLAENICSGILTGNKSEILLEKFL